MVTHMVFFVVKLLNYFPAKGGVSTHYSPKTNMSGQTLNNNSALYHSEHIVKFTRKTDLVIASLHECQVHFQLDLCLIVRVGIFLYLLTQDKSSHDGRGQ